MPGTRTRPEVGVLGRQECSTLFKKKLWVFIQYVRGRGEGTGFILVKVIKVYINCLNIPLSKNKTVTRVRQSLEMTEQRQVETGGQMKFPQLIAFLSNITRDNLLPGVINRPVSCWVSFLFPPGSTLLSRPPPSSFPDITLYSLQSRSLSLPPPLSPSPTLAVLFSAFLTMYSKILPS